MAHRKRSPIAKTPLRVTGVLFALAANLLLATVADILVRSSSLSFSYETLATVIAPVIAGVLTALYVRQRGAVHAFLGGMLSTPVLALYVFGLNWQAAVFAGAFCGVGGSMAELLMRQRRSSE